MQTSCEEFQVSSLKFQVFVGLEKIGPISLIGPIRFASGEAVLDSRTGLPLAREPMVRLAREKPAAGSVKEKKTHPGCGDALWRRGRSEKKREKAHGVFHQCAE